MRDVHPATALLLILALAPGGPGAGVTAAGGHRGAGPPGQDARPAPPATSAILGRVIDGTTGRPLAGAVVTISGLLRAAPTARPASGNQPPRVMTNGTGHFVFRDLPAGSIRLTATKDGYRDGAYGAGRPVGQARPLELGEDDTRTRIEIRLWRQSSISGVVLDELGDPVAGVEVRAVERRMAGGLPLFETREAAQTDDRGRYRVADLRPGDYLVSVQPFIVSVLRSSIEAYDAMTPAERQVSGARRPTAGGVRVGRSQVSTPWPAVQPMPASPGERLQIYRGVFHPSATSPAGAGLVTVRPGDRLDGIDVHLQLTPTVTVAGRLTGVTPQEARDVRLSLIPLDTYARGADTGWDAEVTRTGPDGQFVFAAVPPGDYLIYATHIPPPGRSPSRSSGAGRGLTSQDRRRIEIAERAQLLRWAESHVSVGTTDVDGLAVALQPGLTVSGRFEFRGVLPPPDDDALARIGVGLQGLRDQPHNLPRVPVDGDPHAFRTAGFPPGRYLASVSSPPSGWTLASVMAGGRDVNLDPFTLDEDVEGVTVVFTDSPAAAAIRGSVEPTADASRDVWVAAVPASYQQWIADGLSQRRVGLEPAADGTFELSGLPPGDYLVAAMAVDGDPALQDPEFIRQFARIASRVTLAPGQSQMLALRAAVIR